MPEGGCFCGIVRISYDGQPIVKALCHCVDCRKITGSVYSTNIIVPGQGFKVTKGTPKTISKTADSGNKITSHFCGDCGSTLYRDGPTFSENKVIKVGVMDAPDAPDALDQAKPVAELYVAERVSWVPEILGADQTSGMP